jgi:hypothetical protein
MKYGRSLSFCVKDILTGKINERDVALIVTSTACETREDWNRLIRSYANSYWHGFSVVECSTLVNRLLNKGKIYQPRLIDGRIQDLSCHGNWADSEDEVMASLKVW